MFSFCSCSDILHYLCKFALQGHVQENSKAGSEVLLARKLAALDPDLADRGGVRLELYGKDSEKFRLDPDTGKVSLEESIQDREDKEVYYLRLRAVDAGGNVGEAQLVIHVTDRNDHQPRFLKLQVISTLAMCVSFEYLRNISIRIQI
jgi:Cadherin domain